MNLLLLTQVVPFPPDSGPKIKTFNVLRHLAQHHRVHLVSFVRSADEVRNAEVLREYCASVTTVPLQRSVSADVRSFARSLITGRPFLIERDGVPAMRRALSHLLATQRMDAVHADQISMAQFALNLPVNVRVLDEHNAVWTIVRRSSARERGLRRIAVELEWRKMRRYEADACRRFTVTTVVSEDDRRFLEAAVGGSFSSVVVPITVDTTELAVVPRTAQACNVVSVATMFYPPNVEGVDWFAREVFPIVRQSMPNTQFLIVGSRPPADIARLARPGSGIVVTGYVADLLPVLRQTAVLIAPVLSGSGMRVKILEAFARGIPVVSTTLGVEGIAARANEHLLVGDAPVDFAASVTRLLRDPAEAERLATAARALVETRYDRRVALSALDAIYA